MSTPAVDPKVAPLADELKDFALSLDRSIFPKGFFCIICDHLAFDSFKLLCCNKVICLECHANLEFPTTCPKCDHSPVEADSCPPNKSLRNTMRIWLQKQKRKEEAKAAAQAAASATEPAAAPSSAAAPSETQPLADAKDKPTENVEGASQAEGATLDQNAAASVADGVPRPVSAASQHQDGATTIPDDALGEDGQGSKDAKDDTEQVEPTEGQEDGQNVNGPNGPMFSNNGMLNSMPNQFGFGYNSGQGNFGMGMNPMSNMSNMMNQGWNPMGYNMNNMNGMFGFGGNMGMGMNDMSMNYGGGFGNGWNGMGGAGYGYNGYNQTTGYNQSGAYPEMMNQFPKNHMSNSSRFQGNGPGNFSQQRNNRNGSFGGGHEQGRGGFQNNSRPGSRSGRNKRDGESPGGTTDSIAADDKGEEDKAFPSARPGEDGKEEVGGVEKANDSPKPTQIETATFEDATNATGDLAEDEDGQTSLNPIQTVDSVGMNDQGFGANMIDGSMPMQYHPQMVNQFRPNQMNGAFNHNMGNMSGMGNMGNMGYHDHNNFGMRGGFSHAYGAATVLTGEPRGMGVEGAPTGPRAMREGRPNTGFSSRAHNIRYTAPPQSAPATSEATPGSRSPQHTVRSRSPVRDESLRTKDKSPSRSRTGSQARSAVPEEHRDRSRSVDPEQRGDRAHSLTPVAESDVNYRHQKDEDHRHSHYDRRDNEYERDAHDYRGREDRDSRGSRGDRTRSASVESKYRTRDKDRHRSSRSHRDRSREHRRRHRSRSHSPIAEGGEYGTDESRSRRKDRIEKDRYREKERDRSRDRDRDRDRRDRRDRDYERDYDDNKYRSREKEKDRRRRREREAEEDGRDYDDDKYRSSRRSRKDRDRDYDKETSRAVSPPPNAPTGPSADNFSIRGASKPKALTTMPPPSGPKAFMPPKGPAADRDRDRHHGRKGSQSSSMPSTPIESVSQDHYAAEREKNARARDMHDRGDRGDRSEPRSLHSRISSSHHSSSSTRTSHSKRSHDDYDEEERDPRNSAPVGQTSRDSKRRKDSETGGTDLASALTKGLRKKAGAPRRGGVRNEGDVEKELERVERERDGRRW